MRRTLITATTAAVLMASAACSSSASTPAAIPTSQPPVVTSQPAAPATCIMTSSGDIIERVQTPLGPATAQELGSVDLENCVTAFSEIAKETSTDPGYCSQEAWAKDNPGYDVNKVPAEPLKNVQAQAGAAC